MQPAHVPPVPSPDKCRGPTPTPTHPANMQPSPRRSYYSPQASQCADEHQQAEAQAAGIVADTLTAFLTFQEFDTDRNIFGAPLLYQIRNY